MQRSRHQPHPRPRPGSHPREVPTAIMYVKTRCPKCNSDKVPVTHTDPQTGSVKVRQHKCTDCEWSFQSVEEV